MSHFTNMKTCFQNLYYLEIALNRLNIEHTRKQLVETEVYENLVIKQQTGPDIEFCWNGQEYELVVDLAFWKQSYDVENFIDKIAQQYAGEIIIGESEKMGFQPIKYQQNEDGSNTLILERWNEKVS